MYKLIENNADLKKCCLELSEQTHIAVDTEFFREKTYYAQLCLIQIASSENIYCIDVLSKGLDLSILWPIFQNENIIKIMHSGIQDIEVIYDASGIIPKPIFDTQISASVCGFGLQCSYANLVEYFTDQQIDKSQQSSDWLKRPLNDKQLNYAAKDVEYLIEIYNKLSNLITNKNRFHWIKEEMEKLADEENFKNIPSKAWKKLKYRSLKEKNLPVLRALAAWREETAQKSNLPRTWIIKDQVLISLAASTLSNDEDYEAIRGLPKNFTKSKIFPSFEKAYKAGRNDKNPIKITDKKPIRFNDEQDAKIELLRVLLKHVSSKNEVATNIIANSSDLKLYVANSDYDAPFKRGWRYEIFGIHADSLMNNETALSANKYGISIEKVN